MARQGASFRYPGGWRTLAGVAAFVLGYLVVYVTGGRRFDAIAGRAPVPKEQGLSVAAAYATEGVDPATWRAAGWLFFNAHLVGVSVPAGPMNFVRTNVLLGAGGPALSLLLVPPVTLVGAGVAVTYDQPSAADLRFDLLGGAERYALNGGVVPMFAYLPLSMLLAAAIGAYGYALDGTGAFVVAGMAYPLVFGGLGGLIGRRIAKRRGDGSDDDGDGW